MIALVERLKAVGGVVATVESCTGGLIGYSVSQVPGASEVYWGTLVTYDNSAKTVLARVPPELLARHGAVSPQVAAAMAAGGLQAMRDALASPETPTPLGRSARLWACVATTGIAGPGGGTDAKPVGLCHIAVAVSGRAVILHEVRAEPGRTRDHYQRAFAEAAISQLALSLPDPGR